MACINRCRCIRLAFACVVRAIVSMACVVRAIASYREGTARMMHACARDACVGWVQGIGRKAGHYQEYTIAPNSAMMEVRGAGGGEAIPD